MSRANILLSFALAAALYPAAAAQQPAFDVASIKIAADPGHVLIF